MYKKLLKTCLIACSLLALPLAACKKEKKLQEFTVTWKNYDGTILEIDENVLEGETPTYDGVTPQRPDDESYVYSFSGWSPRIRPVHSDVTYKAQFNSDTPLYTVSFYAGDEVILSYQISRGDIPRYDGQTPTKSGSDDTIYIFKGWDREFTPITRDEIYVAQFEELPMGDVFNYNLINGDEYEVTLKFSNFERVVIPESHDDLPVTRIGDNFCGNSGQILISEIVIPNSITSIGNYAFTSNWIKELVIPDSVTHVESNTFASSICEKLVLGKGIVELNEEGFGSNARLKEFVVSEENPYYSSYDGCLYKEGFKYLVRVPRGKEGAVIIHDECEGTSQYSVGIECYQITSVHFGKNFQSFFESNPAGLFFHMNDLDAITVDPSNPYLEAYENCLYTEGYEKLIYVPMKTEILIIRDECKVLGNFCVGRCENLKEIQLPSGLTTIEDSALDASNHFVKTITLPATLVNFDEGFIRSGFFALTDIFVDPANPVLKDVNGVLYSKDGRKLYRCPREYNKSEEYVVPDGVEELVEWAFFQCFHLKVVRLPHSLTKINYAALLHLNELETVYFNGTRAEWNNALQGVQGNIINAPYDHDVNLVLTDETIVINNH